MLIWQTVVCIAITVFTASILVACAVAPVTASAPTDSLCVATGELHFSEPVLAAMNRADVEAFDHFNETWDAHCGATK